MLARSQQRSRLLYRWLPGLIVVVTAIALLSGVFAIQYVKARLLARSGDALTLAAIGATANLDLLMAERYGDIQMMAQATVFRHQDAEAMITYLRQLQKVYPDYLWLGFADRRGRIIAATDRLAVGSDVRMRTWFQIARTGGGPHIEDAAPSREANGTFAVTLSAPVALTDAGEFGGVVVAQMGLPTLEDTVAHVAIAVQAQLGTQSRVEWQVLNSAGDVMADSILREEGTTNLYRLGVPSALLVKSGPPGFVEERHRRRAIDVLTGYARAKGSLDSPSLGWAVLIRQDRSEILAPIRHVMWFLAAGGSVVFLPTVGLLMWSIRQLQQEWAISVLRSDAMFGLVRAAQQLTSERDLETLLRRLTDIGRELTGATYGAIGVFDQSGAALGKFVTSGMDPATEAAIGTPPVGKGLLGYLTETDGVLRVQDITRHPAAVGVPPHHPVMRSFLGASIRTHGSLFGRLYLTNKQGPGKAEAEFTELDGQVVAALASQAGVAIRNATLLQELTEAETKSRLLLESTGEGICGLDLEGRCIFINQAAIAMLGYRKEELLGQSLHQLVHHRYPDGFPYPLERCPIFRAYQTGQGCRVDDEYLIRKDGTTFPVGMSAHPILDHGRVTGAVVTFQDISERQQAQDALARGAQDLEWKNWELAQARDQALESVRLKEEFLATMSHEIRTPMNGVIGMTELLLDTALSEEQREYVQTLRVSGEGLLGIINDILDFSKIEAGKLDLEIIDFDLRATIESVLDLLAQSAYNKRLELVGLIYAHTPAAVRGDPTRLRQILTNLIGNAIKFTEQGEVVLQVALALDSHEHVIVRFDVSDTGVGVSREGMSRLFQSFSQADGSTTRKYGGTGLGLAICKRLVGLMGGEIGADSEAGKGSRFWFTVRLGKQVAGETVLDGPPAELRGLHVCVVDDNATNRTLLQHYTTAWGMRSESVEDGPHALDLLRASAAGGDPFDLVLIDMDMPGMDGLTLARAVRMDHAIQSIPMVLLASVGQRGDAKAAQEAGIAAYLTKPIRWSQLQECLGLIVRTACHRGDNAPKSGPPLITRHHLAERAARRQKRILVAEDNRINQIVIVRLLEKLGHRADVVVNGREAVAALHERSGYDLVFMDCQMPGMDGYAATVEIRKGEGAARHVPIVALTANAMKDDRDKCLDAGMDDYLSKPITIESLSASLERWRIVPDAEDEVPS